MFFQKKGCYSNKLLKNFQKFDFKILKGQRILPEDTGCDENPQNAREKVPTLLKISVIQFQFFCSITSINNINVKCEYQANINHHESHIIIARQNLNTT